MHREGQASLASAVVGGRGSFQQIPARGPRAGWALNRFQGIQKLESGFYTGSNEKTVPQKKEASLKESSTDT